MDFKLAGTAFVTVFLAELGDKTQLTTLSLASGTGNRLSVFVGSASALVLSSLVAVLAAEAVGRLISPLWLSRAAGLLLLGLGAWTLWSARAG
jgi:Ca2+/H+ antiporter, TMEM165/GDT1 family